MTKSIYSFERTELRTLQNMCDGDNEKFLNMLADIVGNLTKERDALHRSLGMAEHRVRELENGVEE